MNHTSQKNQKGTPDSAHRTYLKG